MMRMILVALVVAACGAAPDKPVLANAPRPDPAAVAGVAAAAAAAITLASPDTAGAKPEKNQDEEKKAITVKESVPGDVLDRLDKKPAEPKPAAAPKQPAGSAKPDVKRPKDALDFSQP